MRMRCIWCKQFVKEENAKVIERDGRKFVFCQHTECLGAQTKFFLPKVKRSKSKFIKL